MSVETKEKAKNQVAKATSGNVALASNPWSKLAAELDRVLGAPILKFAKDGRFALSDTDQVPDGTRCLARVDLVQIGWVKWRGNTCAPVPSLALPQQFFPTDR